MSDCNKLCVVFVPQALNLQRIPVFFPSSAWTDVRLCEVFSLSTLFVFPPVDDFRFCPLKSFPNTLTKPTFLSARHLRHLNAGVPNKFKCFPCRLWLAYQFVFWFLSARAREWTEWTITLIPQRSDPLLRELPVTTAYAQNLNDGGVLCGKNYQFICCSVTFSRRVSTAGFVPVWNNVRNSFHPTSRILFAPKESLCFRNKTGYS